LRGLRRRLVAGQSAILPSAIMSKPLTLLVETSLTPIYQRIIDGFRATLTELGHRVLLIEPDKFESDEDYLTYVKGQSADHYLVTNPLGRVKKYVESRGAFAFELIDIPLIFIHYDRYFCQFTELDKIKQLIEGICRVKDRSIHFCLEPGNLSDLSSLGIERVYPILHASEFTVGSQQPCIHDVSFVGHVLPGLGSDLEEIPCSHRLRADFWQRLVTLDHRIEPSALAFAALIPGEQPAELHQLAVKSFYLSLVQLHSLRFRGEVIRRVDASVDIIGGDPAYLNALAKDRRIQQPNISYFPATANYMNARDHYAGSKINLNITSLQFDQAVINRVVDASAAGGFVLTDWKAGLAELTDVAEQISYRSIEELNHKISYYLHPDHAQERSEIAHVLRQDLRQHCTYRAVVESILSKT
jgi:hypothetical protein